MHHRKHGGDLIWEIGSGYFGCRNDDGTFNAEKFQANACDPQVKLIERKLSQGAKPGHGGVLPGAKVTPEIAQARGVPDKAERVYRFHQGTLEALKEMVQAAGLKHPREIRAHHIVRRISGNEVRLLSNLVPQVESGSLLSGEILESQAVLKLYWPMTSAASFAARP